MKPIFEPGIHIHCFYITTGITRSSCYSSGFVGPVIIISPNTNLLIPSVILISIMIMIIIIILTTQHHEYLLKFGIMRKWWRIPCGWNDKGCIFGYGNHYE